MVEQREGNPWEYVPGLLELVDAGAGADDLGGQEFVAPQVRSMRTDPASMTPAERSRLERLLDWLRGYRNEGTVVEREPIWAPVAEVWPARGGTAEFAYETGTEKEGQAELSVFAVGGFGGASRRTLTSAVRLEAEDAGLAYDTRVLMTVHRYVHKSTGQELHRVDIDAGGEAGEFRARDVDLADHPAGAEPQALEALRERYVVSHVERCAERAGTTERVIRDESLRTWSFNAGTDALPTGPIKLTATCQRTRAFEATFVLPGGQDYAFCAPEAQSPVVPLCVTLVPEGVRA